MKAKSIGGIAEALGQFQKLTTIVNPEAGNDRWQVLQDWLAENPKYKERVDVCLKLPPEQATNAILLSLATEFNIPLAMLNVFDPSGQYRQMAQTAIGHLQELYRERQAKDDRQSQIRDGLPR